MTIAEQTFSTLPKKGHAETLRHIRKNGQVVNWTNGAGLTVIYPDFSSIMLSRDCQIKLGLMGK